MSEYLTECIYSKRLMKKLELLNQSAEHQVDIQIVQKAICYAKKYHDGQMRDSGEPFYSHPLEVAYMVADYCFKSDVIVACILHDIIEDTEVTAGMILDAFGWRIAEIVDRLTRDRPDGSKLSVEEILNNAYEKEDKEVLLIKLADRLHNMQTIGIKPPEKIKKAVTETLGKFLVIAAHFNMQEVERKISKLCVQTTSIVKKRYMPRHFSFLDSYQPLSLTWKSEINQKCNHK